VHLVKEHLRFRIHGASAPCEASEVRVWRRRRRWQRALSQRKRRSGTLVCLGITEISTELDRFNLYNPELLPVLNGSTNQGCGSRNQIRKKLEVGEGTDREALIPDVSTSI
jgi:hypothetical protein